MVLEETHCLVRDQVRALARAEIAPCAADWAKAEAFPPDLFRRLASFGLMGLLAPERYGGSAIDYVSYALTLMELAAGDGALSTVISVHNAPVLAALCSAGSELQKDRFLPAMVAGEAVGGFALTESEAGSDAAALRARAVRAPGGYILNGEKQFITSGRIAGLVIVFAVTDPEAGREGITAFLVPTDRQGYRVARVETKLGQTASDTCSLVFEDLFLEEELRLGPEGAGYRIALANLEAGRIGIAAQSVGMAQAALDVAVAYAKERRTFGKPIIEHQAVGFRLSDLSARLEAARQLTLHAAALRDAGRPCLREAAMAKLVASETAEAVCSGAIQTLGGYGYLEDYGLARIYRDVRVCQIYEGASDIQRLIIARSL
jgi:alkylation response protein AidB-like acyl-CoA dehydrogenase